MLQVARAGALYRLGRWDEAEALLGLWTEASAGRAGAQAQQVAARLRIARARAELATFQSGCCQLGGAADGLSDEVSQTS